MIPKTYNFINHKQQLLKIKITSNDVQIQTQKGWLSTKYIYLFDKKTSKEEAEQKHATMLSLLKKMNIQEQDDYINDEATHLGFRPYK